jgi:phage gp16-like protein
MIAARKFADTARAKQIKAIHAMRRELALAEDSYRAIVSRVSTGRTDSSADLKPAERAALLDELRRFGAGKKSPRKAPRRAGRRPLAPGERQAKIRALWLALFQAGELSDPSEEALDAYVARQTAGAKGQGGVGVASAAWLDQATADRVVKGLRGWCLRVGVPLAKADKVAMVDLGRHQACLDKAPAGFADKVLQLDALWRRLIAVGAMRTGPFADLGTWLRRRAGVAAPYYADPSEMDGLIERLGAWLRKEMAARAIPVPLSRWMQENGR